MSVGYIFLTEFGLDITNPQPDPGAAGHEVRKGPQRSSYFQHLLQAGLPATK